MKIPFNLLALLLVFGGCCKDKLCPSPGLSGCDCETEAVPAKMVIRQFIVTKFPEKRPDGVTWDTISNTAPDLTIVVFQADSVLFSPKTTHFEAKSGGAYVFETAHPFGEVDPKGRYSLGVFDFDLDVPGGQEWMGGIEFTPYQPGLKFPDTLRVDCPECNVGFSMVVTYHF